MYTIINNYNLLIKKYQKIETDSSETEIHDKRVILRRIFPILTAFKIDPSKVKNGEKAFKLFGKLRDIQVQLLKLESIDQTPEIMEYHTFLKQRESELKLKVRRFCKRKDIEFPVIKKKLTLKKTKFFLKTEKSLNKLIVRIQSRSIEEAEDIHKIRIEFKKFRYKVEVLSYIVGIEESKLELLKIYQDKLGEIQDYEVLIDGIKKYCKKRKLDEVEMIDQFEHDQDTLIVSFENQIELFIAVCKDVLNMNQEAGTTDEMLLLSENQVLVEDIVDAVPDVERAVDEQVRDSMDVLVTNAGKVDENNEPQASAENKLVENEEPAAIPENQVVESNIVDLKKGTKTKLKNKKLIVINDPGNPEHLD